MSQFDPYLNWLGIPVHEQPPNLYRLLGIVLFESSPQVIEQAADRQSLTVGAYQAGPHGELCQRLLGEIAMARFNLLDPQQKAGYDAYLQQTLAHRGECAVVAPPPPTIGGAAAPPSPPPYMPPVAPVGGLPPQPPLMQPSTRDPQAGAPGAPPQPIMPQMPQRAMLQGAMVLPLPQPAPAGPVFSPLPTRPAGVLSAPPPQFGNPPTTPGMPSYPPLMPAPRPASGCPGYPAMTTPTMRPAAVPVAAPFPVAARTAASGGAGTAAQQGSSPPVAPPAIPPAAPLRPMDELERLAAQPTKRRRVTKNKHRADYGKEIMIGGIVAAAGALLVIVYLAAQGTRGTGLDGIGDNGSGASHTPLATTRGAGAPAPVEKPRPEKKPAAVALEPHKEGASPTRSAGAPPAQTAAPLRKAPASDDGEFRIRIPAAGPAPRNDIDSPRDLGGPDDPVMGKPDEQ